MIKFDVRVLDEVHFVNTVKVIRAYSQLDLKKAKELADSFYRHGATHFSMEMQVGDYAAFKADMYDCGFAIEMIDNGIYYLLHKAAKIALEEGKIDVTMDILAIINKL